MGSVFFETCECCVIFWLVYGARSFVLESGFIGSMGSLFFFFSFIGVVHKTSGKGLMGSMGSFPPFFFLFLYFWGRCTIVPRDGFNGFLGVLWGALLSSYITKQAQVAR